MSLNELQKQLTLELWSQEADRLEKIEQGSGYRWINESLILATATDRENLLISLYDAQKTIREQFKAARPAEVTIADQNDDDAIALIDAAITNITT